MKTSEKIEALATALVKAQGEARDITKDKQGYGYKYATLESILSMLRPILTKNGLAVVQTHGKQGNDITVTTRIIHTSGEWIEDTGAVEFEKLKGMNNAQAVGSVITYLRRYQISSFLNITSDEDVDGKAQERQKIHNNAQPAKNKPTLQEYLKKHNIKGKDFCLYFKITSAEQAQELLKDKGALASMVEEFNENNS